MAWSSSSPLRFFPGCTTDLGLDYLGIPLELLRSDTLLQQEKGICCISHGLLNPKLHLATKPISLVVSSTLWL